MRDFLSAFFCPAHLALQNLKKDYLIFSYFHNFVPKSDQTKNDEWVEENNCSEIVHTFNQNYQVNSTCCHFLAELAKQCIDLIKNNLYLVLF